MFNKLPHDDRGDGREPSTSARQAADALFAPKPQHIEPSIGEAVSVTEAVRNPRVLAATVATPAEHKETEEPSVKPTVKPVIPAEHVARIRAWLRYGMTVAQVADTYGVTAGEVERVLGGARAEPI
jgi:hypothetical protein